MSYQAILEYIFILSKAS